MKDIDVGIDQIYISAHAQKDAKDRINDQRTPLISL